MKKNTPFLDMYHEWTEIGKMPQDGLCESVAKEFNESIKLFAPTHADQEQLMAEGNATVYWGYGNTWKDGHHLVFRSFTPLRQTIILFCAAMNNEL